MAEQAEIGEIEAHICLPSYLAKSGFRYLPLRLKNPALFFAKDESERGGEIPAYAHARCGGGANWLGNSARVRRARGAQCGSA
jgi:hypothetical protein